MEKKMKNKGGASEVMRRVFAGVLIVGVVFLLLLEVLLVGTSLIPMLLLQTYMEAGVGTGIGSAELLLSELTAVNFLSICMTWLLPSLFFVLLVVYLHIKLFQAAGRKLKGWLKILFARKTS